jgi:hypothetical protein
MDNTDPRWVWYSGGILALIAAAVYYLLELRVERIHWAAVGKRLAIMEMVEEGQVTAEAAAQKLESVNEKPWGSLAPRSEQKIKRHMRIRVNDLSTNTMKVDLRLPLGLVNIVLDAGGQLTSTLDQHEDQELREALTKRTTQGASPNTDVDPGQTFEISIEEDE